MTMEFLETGYPEPSDEYLRPTEFFDYDKPVVADFAAKAIEGATSDKEKAIKAFYAVRDSVRYDPYRITDSARSYSASDVLETGAAYCIPKASLLTAVVRAAGIPSAIGLSDVTNQVPSHPLASPAPALKAKAAMSLSPPPPTVAAASEEAAAAVPHPTAAPTPPSPPSAVDVSPTSLATSVTPAAPATPASPSGLAPSDLAFYAAWKERLVAALKIEGNHMLGGKDAAIVCADANLDRAVPAIAFGAFHNSGQNCAGIERIYVEDGIYDEFTKRLVAATEALRSADDADVREIGPMCNQLQFDIVRDHIADAEAAGSHHYNWKYPHPY